MASHLLGATASELAEPGNPDLGRLLEIVVVTELRKIISNHPERIGIFHLRTKEQREIDVILEDAHGRIVAIEVKATRSPAPTALNGLRWLRRTIGSKLHAGLLLHLGTQATAHGDGLYSVPLSALWDHLRPKR